MRAVFFMIYILCVPYVSHSYTYDKKVIDSNIVHVVRISYNEYRAEIVKANKIGNIGREKVSAMAARSKAMIAINAGFFEIGGKNDGGPSGTMVIAGKVYSVKHKEQPLISIKDGIISISKTNPSYIKSKNISLVSGIPMLLNDGEIEAGIYTKKGKFYTQPHARTALGQDEDGNLLIVVAEHNYIASRSITANSRKDNAGKGVTILQLAKIMRNLGCRDAINLDGGGSSTLWIKGKVVNKTIGDKDESLGIKIERPVSDAIVFHIY